MSGPGDAPEREGEGAAPPGQAGRREKDPRDPHLRARNRALMLALLILVALLFAISIIRMKQSGIADWRRFDTGPERSTPAESADPESADPESADPESAVRDGAGPGGGAAAEDAAGAAGGEP